MKANELRSTGRRFKSVDEMIAAQNLPAVVREGVKDLTDSTRVVDELCLMRTRAGLTQGQLAQRMGCTQSKISKLEDSSDRNLTVGEICDYAKATGSQFSLSFGKRPNHVQAVKVHAAGIRQHLKSRADLAEKHDELEGHIQAFFGEAFFNLLDILSECQGVIEKKRPEVELNVASHQEEESLADLASC